MDAGAGLLAALEDAGAAGAAGFAAAGALAAAEADAEAATARALPLTVKPASDNFAALLSPIPFTRDSKSAQSLNSPCFLRSFKIAFDFTGPKPLIQIGRAHV